jgi:hypothetical protein
MLHPEAPSDTDSSPEDRMGATNLPEDPRRPDARQDLPHPEAALGGADDVEKTTYVTGSGTEPETRAPDDRPIAQVSPGGGFGVGGWLLMLVVGAIALFYGASLFR